MVALRGLTTAAPLKREVRDYPNAQGGFSPRSHDRGPVEAGVTGARLRPGFGLSAVSRPRPR